MDTTLKWNNWKWELHLYEEMNWEIEKLNNWEIEMKYRGASHETIWFDMNTIEEYEYTIRNIAYTFTKRLVSRRMFLITHYCTQYAKFPTL